MASWQEAAEPWVKAGKLVVVGLVQEQHPDRARLYRQWKKIDWPIYIDALNLRDLDVVPVPIGIDESGVARLQGAVTRESLRSFVEIEYPKGAAPTAVAVKPELTKPRDRGDYHFLHDVAHGALDRAVEAYEAAVKADPADARARFRLGVALRARYDSSGRKAGDGQAAVEAWGAALAAMPQKYIWRRRLQQFGPRLDKPYDFYFWVEEARRDILARGEKPVELVAEPAGSEVAPPSKGAAAAAPAIPDPDPKAGLPKDAGRKVAIESIVTPARVRPGHRVRVRVTFRLPEKGGVKWNNEGDALTLTVRPPDGVAMVEGAFTHAKPALAESREVRMLEFEAAVAESTKPGRLQIPAYAAYAVCEEPDGVCRLLRQDFAIEVVVDPAAVKLQ